MMTPCRFSHTDNLLFYSKRHQNSIDLMDFSCISFPLLKDWQDFLLFQDCLFSDLPVCQHETTYNYSSNFIKSKQKYLPGKLYLFHKQLKKKTTYVFGIGIYITIGLYFADSCTGILWCTCFIPIPLIHFNIQNVSSNVYLWY